MARILIVDDEADLRELLRTVLSFDNHDITMAEDGEDALEQMKAAPADLMLLDVMMPWRDGWWVLEQLKSSEVWREIPIVMLTARAADLDRIQGAIGGAVRYVTKPFSVAELRHTITNVLEGAPEPEQRLHQQRQALVQLARLETGTTTEPNPITPARPRLTRLDGPGHPQTPDRSGKGGRTVSRQALSERQKALLDAVLAAPSIRAAATSLKVSRSYLYSTLGRIAEKAGVATGPELLRKLRSGELTVK